MSRLPTINQARASIAAAQKFWRLWDGRVKRAELDADPKGALPGLERRRLACTLTVEHWQWVVAEINRSAFSPWEYHTRTTGLRARKTQLELDALKFSLPMKAESHRAKWHGIADQE